jgi:sugar phosphate isomerase/epimerase
MKLGLLTTALGQMELEHIAAWAPQNGYKALEVAAWPVGRKYIHQAAHLDVAQFTTGAAAGVRDLMDQHGLAISAITYCDNNLHHDLAERARIHQHLRACIQAAAVLDVYGTSPPSSAETSSSRWLIISNRPSKTCPHSPTSPTNTM